MKHLDENQIEEMLRKSMRSPTPTFEFRGERETNIKRRPALRPIGLMAAALALIIGSTAVILPLMNAGPIDPGVSDYGHGEMYNSAPSYVIDETSGREIPEFADGLDRTPYLYTSQQVGNILAPWEQVGFSVKSVTYNNSSTRLLSAGGEAQPLVATNLSVTDLASTRLGHTADPDLVDISHSEAEGHEKCLGVYLNINTGEIECLQHRIYSALGDDGVLKYYGLILENYIKSCSEYDGTPLDVEGIYNGKHYSFRELGMVSYYRDEDRMDPVIHAQCLDRYHEYFRKLKDHMCIKIVEYGIDREWCIFVPVWNYAALDDVRDPKNRNCTFYEGYYLFNTVTEQIIPLGDCLGDDGSGEKVSVIPSPDYSAIACVPKDSGNVRIIFPNEGEVRSVDLQLFWPVDEYPLYSLGDSKFSASGKYLCYKLEKDQLAVCNIELLKQAVEEEKDYSPVILPGVNKYKFALNESLIIVNRGIHYDTPVDVYESVTGERIEDISVVPEGDRYDLEIIDGLLTRVDYLTGGIMKTVSDKEVLAVSRVFDGGYAFVLYEGAKSLVCYDIAQDKEIYVAFSDEFLAKISEASEISDISFTLATDQSGMDVVLYYHVRAGIKFGVPRYDKDYGYGGYLNEMTPADRCVRPYDFFAYYMRIFTGGAKTEYGDTELVFDAKTVEDLTFLSAVLFKDIYLEGISDLYFSPEEYKVLRAAFTEKIPRYLEIGENGNVRIRSDRFASATREAGDRWEYFGALEYYISGGTLCEEKDIPFSDYYELFGKYVEHPKLNIDLLDGNFMTVVINSKPLMPYTGFSVKGRYITCRSTEDEKTLIGALFSAYINGISGTNVDRKVYADWLKEYISGGGRVYDAAGNDATAVFKDFLDNNFVWSDVKTKARGLSKCSYYILLQPIDGEGEALKIPVVMQNILPSGESVSYFHSYDRIYFN